MQLAFPAGSPDTTSSAAAALFCAAYAEIAVAPLTDDAITTLTDDSVPLEEGFAMQLLWDCSFLERLDSSGRTGAFEPLVKRLSNSVSSTPH